MMYLQAKPPLTFCEAISSGFKNYCSFTGRARRSEFWFFHLFCAIVMSVLTTIFVIILVVVIFNEVNRHHTKKYEDDEDYEYSGAGKAVAIVIFVILDLILCIPLISMSIRRLHDTGKSGFFYFLNCLPCGSLCLLFFYIEDSQQGMNEYGPSPKYLGVQNGGVGGVINNQIIPVQGMVVPNAAYPQVYPQAYPQVYPQAQEPTVQPNLYQAPPPSDPQLATPMVSNNI